MVNLVKIKLELKFQDILLIFLSICKKNFKIFYLFFFQFVRRQMYFFHDWETDWLFAGSWLLSGQSFFGDSENVLPVIKVIALYIVGGGCSLACITDNLTHACTHTHIFFSCLEQTLFCLYIMLCM